MSCHHWYAIGSKSLSSCLLVFLFCENFCSMSSSCFLPPHLSFSSPSPLPPLLPSFSPSPSPLPSSPPSPSLLASLQCVENAKALDEAHVCLKLVCCSQHKCDPPNIVEYFGVAPLLPRQQIQLFMEIMPSEPMMWVS